LLGDPPDRPIPVAGLVVVDGKAGPGQDVDVAPDGADVAVQGARGVLDRHARGPVDQLQQAPLPVELVAARHSQVILNVAPVRCQQLDTSGPFLYTAVGKAMRWTTLSSAMRAAPRTKPPSNRASQPRPTAGIRLTGDEATRSRITPGDSLGGSAPGRPMASAAYPAHSRGHTRRRRPSEPRTSSPTHRPER